MGRHVFLHEVVDCPLVSGGYCFLLRPPLPLKIARFIPPSAETVDVAVCVNRKHPQPVPLLLPFLIVFFTSGCPGVYNPTPRTTSLVCTFLKVLARLALLLLVLLLRCRFPHRIAITESVEVIGVLCSDHSHSRHSQKGGFHTHLLAYLKRSFLMLSVICFLCLALSSFGVGWWQSVRWKL